MPYWNEWGFCIRFTPSFVYISAQNFFKNLLHQFQALMIADRGSSTPQSHEANFNDGCFNLISNKALFRFAQTTGPILMVLNRIAIIYIITSVTFEYHWIFFISDLAHGLSYGMSSSCRKRRSTAQTFINFYIQVASGIIFVVSLCPTFSALKSFLNSGFSFGFDAALN